MEFIHVFTRLQNLRCQVENCHEKAAALMHPSDWPDDYFFVCESHLESEKEEKLEEFPL